MGKKAEKNFDKWNGIETSHAFFDSKKKTTTEPCSKDEKIEKWKIFLLFTTFCSLKSLIAISVDYVQIERRKSRVWKNSEVASSKSRFKL